MLSFAPSLLLLSLFSSAGRACFVTNVGEQTCSKTGCSTLSGGYQFRDGFVAPANPNGGINYEFFIELGPDNASNNRKWSFLAQVPASNVTECCRQCSSTAGCQFFRYFPSGTTDNFQSKTNNVNPKYAFTYTIPYPTCNLDNCGTYDVNNASAPCILLSFSSDRKRRLSGSTCSTALDNGCYPVASSNNEVVGPDYVSGSSYITSTGTIRGLSSSDPAFGKPRSYFGGSCNPASGGGASDDPHFIGGDGVPFDFNGQLDKSFCLLSDERVHINVKMGGYMDSRTYGASVMKDGKAIRSWMTSIYILWKDLQGQRHSLFMDARKGKQQERGQGFVSASTLDGEAFSLSEVGQSVEGGGAVVTLSSQGKRGPFDQDEYKVDIPGVLSGALSLRVAHPLLQTEDEAFAHFNVRVDEYKPSPTVHGVLGQTLRADGSRVGKVLEYKVLTSLLRGPMQADGVTGEGYLEGQTEDYVSSSLDQPDCHFTQFV